MTKLEIDQKYTDLHNAIEVDYFNVVNEGKPNQHLKLKVGKTKIDFNTEHADNWRNHETELIKNGFMEAPVEPEPVRDLEQEIDELKATVGILEKK